jgi:hypothetical protein
MTDTHTIYDRHGAPAFTVSDDVTACWSASATEIRDMVNASLPGLPAAERAALYAFMSITRKRETAEAMLADEAARQALRAPRVTEAA